MVVYENAVRKSNSVDGITMCHPIMNWGDTKLRSNLHGGAWVFLRKRGVERISESAVFYEW